MPDTENDVKILRDLAKQYADIAAKPIQDERRKLWSDHQSLNQTRPLILATYGMWNVWCGEVFGDASMKCADPFYRMHERTLRMGIFHDSVGDDFIIEPWQIQGASLKTPGDLRGGAWGLNATMTSSSEVGGAWKSTPPIQSWDDMDKLTAPEHCIDEDDTARNVQKIGDAIGDLLEINVERGPSLRGFGGDISTTLAYLRGLEQIMIDMYESPDELHRLLGFMRDGILANQQQAEANGDFSLTSQSNQAMPYADDLEPMTANSGSRKRSQLWGFCAAQEYTLISPEFHDEFLFQYQMPIMEHYAHVHYGCCEDLTRKIDMLRQLSNLRSIAVTPAADIEKCANQIGNDYVISWRPNPTDMVCTGWDEDRIRKIVTSACHACKGLSMHIHLKDIETVQGDPGRLARWTEIARETAEAIQ